MPDAPVAARPASTVLVVRSNGDLEVLMVKRPDRGFFGGLMVFPGGAVEACDRAWNSYHPDAEFRVAGVRETAEEVGFIITETGFTPSPPGRGAELLDQIEESGHSMGLDRLTLISRWVTPRFAPTRFDTRFYVVSFQGDPDVVVDRDEIEEHVWVSPHVALEFYEEGQWAMILPTISHLRWLSRRQSADEAVAAASGADGLTIIEPISADGDLKVRYRGEK